MRKISTLAAGVALSALVATGALATDLRGSAKDADVFASPGVVNWTGFYVGVQGGYGNANHNLKAEEYVHINGDEEEEDFNETFPIGSLDGVNSHGGIGGGRVGFDLARGRLLFGVFAEYNFTNMETELTISGGPADVKFGLEKDDEWSVGGRLGYIVAPRTLAYVLAAYTQTEYDVTGFDGAVVSPAFLNKGATFDGVTVGGGIEFALTGNVFFGMEYTHTFYGEETIFDAGFKGVEGREGTRVIDDLDEDKIMATLKIKLNSGLFGN